MAKTKTSFSSHPKLIQIFAIIITSLTVISFIIGIIIGCMGKYDSSYPYLFFSYMSVLCVELFYFSTGWIEIDDEKRTLTVSSEKKHPLDVMKIDRIVRHIDKKGRVKYLTIHEAGVRYIDVRICPESESDILGKLKKIKPEIEVAAYRF